MCHARSGCWSRFNCARYSISKEYWEKAGSHSPDTSSLDQAYRACMGNENCILNTLKSYTEQYGERVCSDKYSDLYVLSKTNSPFVRSLKFIKYILNHYFSKIFKRFVLNRNLFYFLLS